MKISPGTLPLRAAKTSYICRQCRLPRPSRIPNTTRSFFHQPSPPPPPPSGRTVLKSRSLLHLWGPDTIHYLQGAITRNVSAANPPTEPFYAAFLDYKGRIRADVFIYPLITDKQKSTFGNGLGDSWLIEVDAEQAQRLKTHILRYRLRSKFEVRYLEPGEADVWTSWDDTKGKDEVQTSTTYGLNDTMGLIDRRAPGLGKRFIIPGNQSPEEVLGKDFLFPPTTEDSYKIRRYLNGVPEGQKELLMERAFVQESNLDYMGGVDYRKGCYAGQELVIRTHHTGTVRKRLMPVVLYENHDPPTKLEYKEGPAASIPEGYAMVRTIPKKAAPSKPTTMGKWITGVGNLGLGLVKLGIMTGSKVEAGIDEFCFSPENVKVEKLLEEDDPRRPKVKQIDPEHVVGFKVRAFRPAWYAERSSKEPDASR